jgi:hypothetical protein
MIEAIFKLSESIRYVAVYRNGRLELQSRARTLDASSSESDRYEELLVNPTLLKLASQRGNIDCGGLEYLIVRYGNFFQFVLPTVWGHVSVCIESDENPIHIGSQVKSLVQDAS